MTKAVLIILMINSFRSYGDANPIQIDMPSMAHCEAVAEHINEIKSEDEVMSRFHVSTNCIER
jgi:hypothetical protein